MYMHVYAYNEHVLCMLVLGVLQRVAACVSACILRGGDRYGA